MRSFQDNLNYISASHKSYQMFSTLAKDNSTFCTYPVPLCLSEDFGTLSMENLLVLKIPLPIRDLGLPSHSSPRTVWNTLQPFHHINNSSGLSYIDFNELGQIVCHPPGLYQYLDVPTKM